MRAELKQVLIEFILDNQKWTSWSIQELERFSLNSLRNIADEIREEKEDEGNGYNPGGNMGKN